MSTTRTYKSTEDALNDPTLDYEELFVVLHNPDKIGMGASTSTKKDHVERWIEPKEYWISEMKLIFGDLFTIDFDEKYREYVKRMKAENKRRRKKYENKNILTTLSATEQKTSETQQQ